MSRDARRVWSALLLCAGASTRMGSPKALLEWCGMPLLAHQVRELLATRIRHVTVVLGANADEIVNDPRVSGVLADPGVACVMNPRWQEGKCTSIRIGAATLPKGATDVVILSVDQPTAAEVLEAVMGGLQAAGGEGAVPTYRRARGHPLILGESRIPELHHVREEEKGLRAIVSRLEGAGLLAEIEVGAPCIRWNFNEKADVRAATRRFSVLQTTRHGKDIH